MPLIILLLLIAAIVWTLAIARVKLPLDELKKFSHLHVVGLCVVLTGAVFGHDFFHTSGGPIPITIDRLLLAGLLALAGIGWLRSREDLRSINIMDLTILGVVGLLAFSTLTHDYRFSNNLPLSRLLFFYLMPMTLYWVVRTAKFGELDMSIITIVMGSLAVYLALTGIAEMKQLYSIVFPKYIVDSSVREFFGRGRGPFLNPVSNGIFQVIGLCCIWFWWSRASQRVRIVILAASIVVTLGVYATLTRSVWLTLLLVGALGLWLTTSVAQKGTLVIAATLAALLLLPVVGDKLSSFKRDEDVTVAQMSESAQLRPLFLTVAMRMFEDRPILGCGFGQYAHMKYPYLQDAFTGQPLSKTKSYYQHNVFLAYLVELGLAGLILFLLMLGVMGRSAWLLWCDKQKTLEQRQSGLLLGAMLICYCVNGMFHDTSIMPMANTLLLFCAGIVNNIQTEPAVSMATTVTKVPTHRSPQHGCPATG